MDFPAPIPSNPLTGDWATWKDCWTEILKYLERKEMYGLACACKLTNALVWNQFIPFKFGLLFRDTRPETMLKYVSRTPNLVQLTLTKPCPEVFQAITKLKKLFVSRQPIEDWSWISHLTDLEYLQTQCVPENSIHLLHRFRLKSLKLDTCGITWSKQLGPPSRDILVVNPNFGHALASLTTLEGLVLPLDGRPEFEPLSNLTKLTRLHNFGLWFKPTGQDYSYLGHWTNLQKLFWTKSPVPPSMMNLTNLVDLWMDPGPTDNRLPGDGIMSLTNLASLSITLKPPNLHLLNTKIFNLTNLKSLHLLGGQSLDIPYEIMYALKTLPNITSLELKAFANHSAQWESEVLRFMTSLKYISFHPKSFGFLQGLSLRLNSLKLAVDNLAEEAQWDSFSCLTGLTKLRLSRPVGSRQPKLLLPLDWFEAIQGLTNLQNLGFSSNVDASIDYLTRLTNLTLLAIGKSDASGIATEKISKCMTHLQNVELAYCQNIGPEQLKCFSHLPNLKTNWLPAGSVSFEPTRF